MTSRQNNVPGSESVVSEDDAASAVTFLTLVDSGAVQEPPPRAPELELLAFLIRDAQRRHRAELEGRQHEYTDDPVLDMIRLNDAAPDLFKDRIPKAAERAGLKPAQLARLRTAYKRDGLPGAYAVLRASDPRPETLEEAATAIRALRLSPPPDLTFEQNRITNQAAGVQVRLSIDEHWYPFAGRHDDWVPAEGHSHDPATAYQAAIRARNRRSPY